MELQAHKFADIFPMMEGDAFEELKKDIQEQGLQQTIVLYEGKILDGRNRYKACKDLGIDPRFEEYKGNSPLQFVISLNLKRRHLNESQRGLIASRLATFNWGGNRQEADLPLEVSQKQASKMLNVSERTVRSIKRIEREAPQYLPEIEKGDKRADEVIKELKIETRKNKIELQRKAIKENSPKLPTGKYEIIVIDPPWDYGSDESYNPESFRGTTPYPTMSIEELKKIKIPSSDNCVLWLWTTNLFMRHAFVLLDSWGFKEKTILTWAKNKMGTGRWLRSKTEHCIMAIKGNPTIDLKNQTTLLEASVKEHSVKPQEFYDMVEELCIGRKLDYFARKKREGWDVYGDEIKEEK